MLDRENGAQQLQMIGQSFMQRGQQEDNEFFGDAEMEANQQNDHSQLLDVSQFKSCLNSPSPKKDPLRMPTRQSNKKNRNNRSASQ